MDTNQNNKNNADHNNNLANWIARARQWPQRKKLNFIFTFTGAVILILLIVWLLIGGYKPNDGSSAQNTISGIINSIKHP